MLRTRALSSLVSSAVRRAAGRRGLATRRAALTTSAARAPTVAAAVSVSAPWRGCTRTLTTSTAAASSGGDGGKPSVAQAAFEAVKSALPEGFTPRAGIVLGSGLGPVSEIIEDATRIPYADIPDFPVSTVSGHAGELVCGTLAGVPVAALKGRVHLYEGVDPQTLRVPIYMLKMLGCDVLFVTSAVGSTRAEVGPGELVAVTDHINMQGRNVLIGPNDDATGLRFPAMNDAYDPKLRALMHELATEHGVKYTDGVFLSTLGPSFETPAEIRAFRTLGADVVGMSMIPEVVAARHCGLRVSATAVVVNLAAGMTDTPITHDETIHFGNLAAENLTKLLQGFLSNNAKW